MSYEGHSILHPIGSLKKILLIWQETDDFSGFYIITKSSTKYSVFKHLRIISTYKADSDVNPLNEGDNEFCIFCFSVINRIYRIRIFSEYHNFTIITRVSKVDSRYTVFKIVLFQRGYPFLSNIGYVPEIHSRKSLQPF